MDLSRVFSIAWSLCCLTGALAIGFLLRSVFKMRSLSYPEGSIERLSGHISRQIWRPISLFLLCTGLFILLVAALVRPLNSLIDQERLELGLMVVGALFAALGHFYLYRTVWVPLRTRVLDFGCMICPQCLYPLTSGADERESRCPECGVLFSRKCLKDAWHKALSKWPYSTAKKSFRN